MRDLASSFGMGGCLLLPRTLAQAGDVGEPVGLVPGVEALSHVWNAGS